MLWYKTGGRGYGCLDSAEWIDLRCVTALGGLVRLVLCPWMLVMNCHQQRQGCVVGCRLRGTRIPPDGRSTVLFLKERRRRAKNA